MISLFELTSWLFFVTGFDIKKKRGISLLFLLGIYFCVLSFLIWDQVMLGSLKISGSVI